MRGRWEQSEIKRRENSQRQEVKTDIRKGQEVQDETGNDYYKTQTMTVLGVT